MVEDIIELTPEKIYYTIIGKYGHMTKLIDKINKVNKKKNVTYFISKLIVPIDFIIEKFDDKEIEIVSYTELMQCILLSNCRKKDEELVYVLLCLVEREGIYYLQFPEISIIKNTDPEKDILYDIENISGNIPKSIRKNLNMVDIIGNRSEILLYSSLLR